jgi:peptide-methionine (S)-S-oxide reductase
MSIQKATFGAGHFSKVAPAFRALEGVVRTSVGFARGQEKNSKQAQTEAVQAVQVEFDPSILTYEELLDTFWVSHDPTSENRQGDDVGTEFRSVIFYNFEEQKKSAHTSKKKRNKAGFYKKPIVTEITKLKEFMAAEESSEPTGPVSETEEDPN